MKGSPMKIRIKNLTLKTIVGLNDWEQKEAQEVIINIELEFDGKKADRKSACRERV